MRKVLTIAGSDSSGGAGIQADLKTIAAHRMYGMSAITALTAQNTMGVFGIRETEPSFVAQQIDAVFSDILPDAVKIGMVSSAGIIAAIAERLRHYGAEKVVLDPVMVSTSGNKLLLDDARGALVRELFPLASVVTPNIPEAELLSGLAIRGREGMLRAAELIAKKTQGAVLVKGGHAAGDAADLLFERGEGYWLEGERVNNPNTHGTGCTLSSAVACNLAAGLSLRESARLAKTYLTGALKAMLDLGHGSGPLDHMGGAGN
ncbi:MAG: bifunctional hydroxymethylpyrimidine kinase/phosphomethylpyrimidine kinase [Christensenellaceae bacterium]|jgi:hydroxymethylpyrimidine/phosphomethylpyrimidine kinase|nr:bifunctional hydroxymethylpyrimidine kinase/phosphomethylpyrimidine kinase [Christensenellaceae bacterium]